MDVLFGESSWVYEWSYIDGSSPRILFAFAPRWSTHPPVGQTVGVVMFQLRGREDRRMPVSGCCIALALRPGILSLHQIVDRALLVIHAFITRACTTKQKPLWHSA